jgi:hypothetical protein
MKGCAQKLILWFWAARDILLALIDVARYVFTYPWRDSLFCIEQTLKDPDRYLDQWIRARQSEYSFIGLVVSTKFLLSCGIQVLQ